MKTTVLNKLSCKIGAIAFCAGLNTYACGKIPPIAEFALIISH
jgi:hypothetical protein